MTSAQDPGPLADEAAKLLGALGEWAHQIDDHGTAANGQCQWCPVCRGLRAARHVSPEVKIHLSNALSSLAQAAAALGGSQTPPSAPDQRSGM